MMINERTSFLKNRVNSFKHACNGLVIILKTEVNFKIHLVLLFVVIGLGWFLDISSFEWLVVIIISSVVMVSEAFNTALEYVVDLASPEYHLLAKKAKDVGAASALIASIGAVIIGLIIFLPKMYFKLQCFLEQ